MQAKIRHRQLQLAGAVRIGLGRVRHGMVPLTVGLREFRITLGDSCMPNKSNVGLDVIRGLAALLVVLGHTRVFVSSGLETEITASHWQKALLLPASFAQESVAVFFVLSGYLVGGQVLREFQRNNFYWLPYMAKRLSRLWTVLLPGIVFTLLVDAATIRVVPELWGEFAYGGVGAGAALCNAVFLQVPHCDPYGTNASLWSLAYEFWFYVLFPAVVVVIVGFLRRRWATILSGFAVAVGVVVIFGVGLFALIPAWLLGAGLAALHARWMVSGVPRWFPRSSSPALVFALFALTGAGMFVSNLAAPQEWQRFLLVGIACAPLIMVTAVRPWKRTSRVIERAKGVGTISFSVYVFHLPLVKLLLGLLSLVWSPGPISGILAVYAITAVVTVACIPLWAITERHTGRVRNFFLRIVSAWNTQETVASSRR